MASVVKKISGGVRSKDGLSQRAMGEQLRHEWQPYTEAKAEVTRKNPFLKGLPYLKHGTKITSLKGWAKVEPARREKGFAIRERVSLKAKRKRSAREDLAKEKKMLFPHKNDTDIFKAIQDRIHYYATGQSKTTSIEETKKILEELGKMRETWLNLYGLNLEEANNLIWVQRRF